MNLSLSARVDRLTLAPSIVLFVTTLGIPRLIVFLHGIGTNTKAVVDCGSASRLIPTPRGGAHGGKAMPLSAGGGVPPWQMAQGKASHENIDYTHVPIEDLRRTDVAAMASLFQVLLAFILRQLTTGRTKLVLLSFSNIATTEKPEQGAGDASYKSDADRAKEKQVMR